MFRSVVDNNLFTLTLIVWKSAYVSICWAEASLMQWSIDRREHQPPWSCNTLGFSLLNQRSPHVCFTTNSEHLLLADSGLKCFLLFQNYSSTLFCLVQISPGPSSLLVDPHSFPVTMVQYFLLVDAFSSGVCGFSALAAFCSIGISGLILKLITFAYREADASDTLPEVHWGCCLSKPAVFFFLHYCYMTWPLDCVRVCVCTRVLASCCTLAGPRLLLVSV